MCAAGTIEPVRRVMGWSGLEVEMSTSTSETKVEKAPIGDLTAGPNGEKMENGHPVTKTTTTIEDDEDEGQDD